MKWIWPMDIWIIISFCTECRFGNFTVRRAELIVSHIRRIEGGGRSTPLAYSDHSPKRFRPNILRFMSYDHCHHEFASSGWIFECFQDSSSSKLCPLLSHLKFLVTVFNKVVGCQLSTILNRTHPKTFTWWSSRRTIRSY